MPAARTDAIHAAGWRIVAVGTTAVRTLEVMAALAEEQRPRGRGTARR